MKIKLLSVGTKMPGWIQQGVDEYCKRLPKDFQLSLVEVPMAKRSKTSNVKRMCEIEGKGLLSQVSPSDHVVAMDVLGKSFSTERLADKFKNMLPQGKNICLLVGGPDGLDQSCLARADESWSLSELTLPHPIVRIVLAEQIYRVWSVMQGHPYHRS